MIKQIIATVPFHSEEYTDLCQSVSDHEANMQFDEMRDNELQDRLVEEVRHQDSNIVY